MDGVLVNFQSGIDRLTSHEKLLFQGQVDNVPGIFSRMDPYDGAIDFVNELSEDFDCYILSSASWGNPTCLNDKLEFIKKHFGNLFYKKTIFSHNKHLNVGDFLIDDRTANGAGEFTGKHIHFGSKEFPDYDSVLRYLKAKN